MNGLYDKNNAAVSFFECMFTVAYKVFSFVIKLWEREEKGTTNSALRYSLDPM